MGQSDALRVENERLRRALLIAADPLLTLHCAIKDQPYREMSHVLMAEIAAADNAVRSALNREAVS